jgi:hypothetical protein
MEFYSIWAISLFLQESVQSGFWNPTIVGWQNILAWRKLWSFSRNIFIGQNFDKMLASISDLTLHVPFPSQPSKSKAYTPLSLSLRILWNPSLWITCLAFHTPSKEMIVYLWSLIGFQRWSSSQPTRITSQWKILPSSSSNECGSILGYHRPSSPTGTTISSAPFVESLVIVGYQAH